MNSTRIYVPGSFGLWDCVFFRDDNSNTLDEDSEPQFSNLSSIAQNKRHKLSSQRKLGYQQATKVGVVPGSNRILCCIKNVVRLVMANVWLPQEYIPEAD